MIPMTNEVTDIVRAVAYEVVLTLRTSAVVCAQREKDKNALGDPLAYKQYKCQAEVLEDARARLARSWGMRDA